MSNSDGQIIIQVTLDDKDAKKGLDGIDKETGKLEKGAAGKFKNVAKGVATVGTAALGAVGLIAGVGVAIGGLAAPLVKAAGDAQAMNAQFSTVFGEIESTATAALNRIGEETSILPDRLKGSFTQMAAFAKTTGMETAEALALTERATLAAADSAAFYDRSIEEVTENLQSFLKGNYENDAALGISATETTRNAKANELYGESFNKLSEAQKQLTLLAMVEDGNALSGALGQAAREGDGLENVIGNFKQAWENLKVALGEPILDIAIAGIKGLTDIINGFDVSPFVSAFENLKSNVSVNGEAIRATAEQAFNGLKSVIESVLNVVVPFVQSQVEKIKQFWAENGQQILQAVTNAFNGVKAVIDFVMPAIKFVVEFVWNAIKDVISGAIDVILGVIKTFSSLFTGDWEGLWDGIKQILSGAVDLILGITSLSFVGGIRKLFVELVESGVKYIRTMWDDIVKWFQTSKDEVIKKVQGLKDDFVKKVIEMKDEAIKKAGELKDEFVKKVKEIDLLQVGRDIVQGLVNGITSKLTDAWNAAASIGSAVINGASTILQRRSPSRVFIAIGKDTVQGLINGIKAKESDAVKQMEHIANELIEVGEKYSQEVKDREQKFADDFSDMNEKTYQSVLKIQQKAIKEKRSLTEYEHAQIKKLEDDYRKDKLALEKKLNADLAKLSDSHDKSRLETIQRYIDDQKSLGLLTTQQEAEIWRQSIESFTAGSALRIKAQQNYNAAIEAISKERLDAVQQFINDKKSLEQLSLTDEARIWQESLVLFDEGTKERITAQQNYKKAVESVQKEVTSINQYYANEITRISNDLIKNEEAITQKYEDALGNRSSALYNFAGIFDQVKYAAEISGQQLLENLASQVVAMEDWSASMKELASRGVEEGLLAELRALGPKAAAEIQALNTLTNEELSAYNELWRQKSALAVEEATKELAPMKDEMEKSITEMREAAASELDVLKDEWAEKIKGVNEITSESLTLDEVGRQAGQSLLDGLASMEGPLLDQARSIAEGIKSTLTSALSDTAPVEKSTKGIADAIKKTTKKELDINSPSEEGAKLAEEYPAGIVVGIERGIKEVEAAGKKLAESLKDSTRQNMYSASKSSSGGSGGAVAAAKEVNESLKEQLEIEKAIVAERKRLSQLSLTEELELYEQFIQGYAEGTDEYIYYLELIQDKKKDIYDELTSINTKYGDLIRKANEKLAADSLKLEEDFNKKVVDLKKKAAEEEKKIIEARKKELTDFAGIFDKVSRKEGVTGKRLMIALQSQVDTIKKWQSNLESLSAKGMDSALLSELEAMGPSAATEIAALNSLSKEELDKYASIWREKSALATAQVEKELGNTNSATAKQIAEIRANTASEIEAMRADMEAQLATMRKETSEQLDIYEREWRNAISRVKDGTKNEFNAMVSEMPEIGRNVIEGMMQGLSDMTPDLLAQANAIAESIKATIQAALDIHSPSRWARDFIMGNLAKGFVLGANDNKGMITGAAGKMAEWLKPGLKFNPAIVNSTGLYAGRLGMPSSVTNSNSSVHTDNSKHNHATFHIHGSGNSARDVKRAWREMIFRMG